MRSALLLLPVLLAANPAPPLLVGRVEVKDVVPLKELKQHAVVLVSKEDGMVLPRFVDETAAVAIAFRLMGRPTPHPLAHDLLDRIVPSLSGDGSPRSGSTDLKTTSTRAMSSSSRRTGS